MSTALTTRHADLGTIAKILEDQQGRKIDVVVSPSDVRAESGNLRVSGVEPILTPDGVTPGDLFRPTEVADEGLSEKLGIPRAYLAKMREQAVNLYDLNVNGWLDRVNPGKRYLVRGFRGDDGDGVARAFLSDSYKRIENLDVLMAVLDGVAQSGVHVDITGCDLTERRMYVRISAPEVFALAPDLLRNYRSPFTGAAGADNPVVFAGFVVTNSEVGCGAFSIVPRVTIRVCKNGVTHTQDAVRNVHLGGRLDEGVVQWSDDTQKKHLDLISAKARDAVTQFLTPDYVQAKVTEMERDAGVEVTDVEKTLKVVGQTLAFNDDRRASILSHFVKGGDTTAGGVMQAVTSVAQTLDDADEAYDMESKALRAMALAAAHA